MLKVISGEELRQSHRSTLFTDYDALKANYRCNLITSPTSEMETVPQFSSMGTTHRMLLHSHIVTVIEDKEVGILISTKTDYRFSSCCALDAARSLKLRLVSEEDKVFRTKNTR